VADIQCRLFDLGAELASSRPVDDPAMPRIEEQDVATLERAIDRIEAKLEPLKSFIVPGGSRAAAQLHVARTVSRRAERRLVALTAHEAVRGELMRYLNRLSDLLFMMARDANRQRGVADVPWQGRARSAASSRESS
jgi:cob(I)alamin adenosyltransferase